jgi:two-component system CheB/CheR fusion protein
MPLRPDNAYFDQILEHLRQSRGFDSTAYKRSSLIRRVLKRMQMVAVPTFEQYLDYLQVHHDEFPSLFNTILINVTSFFRDPEVWAYLSDDLLPAMVANRQRNQPLRIWSAGCASGQEAYTIAMLLAEQLGFDALRERVKIYATDLDDEALMEARHAVYTERQVDAVPPEALTKYFERAGDSFSVNRDLRRAVIFGKHDVIQDAPISRIDLLFCRNTLMYFNADAQARVLSRFSYSVNIHGFLVLGRAEMLFSHSALFVPVDLKRRVFRTVHKSSERDHLPAFAQTGRDSMSKAANHLKARDAAFESDSIPQLVLDPSNRLLAANALARQQFGVSPRDIGRELHDLDVSYRPVELRAGLDRVRADLSEVTLKGTRWPQNGAVLYFDVTLSPLFDDDKALIGTRVAFADVTEFHRLRDELEKSRRELETAYEELQSTNEELETTNEELQSTVEELETTNEELQSTNEELETMNEELQSTNEELQTMNDELRNRSTELNSANSYLESVFTSLQSAVIVLDRDYQVKVWNSRSERLWGVRSDEAHDQHFLGLDIGLPVGDLKAPIREVLNGVKDNVALNLPAVSRRGKPIECQVTVSPLRTAERTIEGVILTIEEGQAAS